MKGYKIIVNHGLGADDESEEVLRVPDKVNLDAVLEYIYGDPNLFVDFRAYRGGDKLEDIRCGFYDSDFRKYLREYDTVPGTVDYIVLDISLCNDFSVRMHVDENIQKNIRALIDSVPHFGRNVFSIEITNPEGGLLHRAFGEDKVESLLENIEHKWEKLGSVVMVKIVFFGKDLKRISGAGDKEYPKRVDGATFGNEAARSFIVGALDHLTSREMASLHVEIDGQRFCTREAVHEAMKGCS